MTKQTFVIRKELDVPPCISWIRKHLDQGPLEVTVRVGIKSRSVRQNSLYWLWATEIGNHLGLRKDEVHELLKRRFAVPIFERDDPDYAEMIKAARDVYKAGMKGQAKALIKEIARLTSTTDFDVDQMSEYLTDVEMYAKEAGAELTFPDELYSSK